MVIPGCTNVFAVQCVNNPGNIIYQLGNIILLLSTVVEDLLYIRLSLGIGFLFLLIWALMGIPSWSKWLGIGISVDAAVYFFLNTIVNVYLAIRLLRDSRPIKFQNSQDERLWRGLYRRGGMSRIDMLHILKIGQWVEYEAGETIQFFSPNQTCEYFHILYAGTAVIYMHHDAHSGNVPLSAYSHKLYPMDVFDLSLGNHFGVYVCTEKRREVVAQTPCIVFRIPASKISELVRFSFNIANAFRAITMASLASHYRRQFKLHTTKIVAPLSYKATSTDRLRQNMPAESVDDFTQNHLEMYKQMPTLPISNGLEGYSEPPNRIEFSDDVFEMQQRPQISAAEMHAARKKEYNLNLSGSQVVDVSDVLTPLPRSNNQYVPTSSNHFLHPPLSDLNPAVSDVPSVVQEDAACGRVLLMSMDCVRPLFPAEDDCNEWTIRNTWSAFVRICKNPFHHTYGIRNACQPTKSPLYETREAVATNTTAENSDSH